MGLRNLLGIDELEKENHILKERLAYKNTMLGSIYEYARDYMKMNYSIAHVGLEKIKQIADTALDD